jgi:hypothetical protein
LVDRLGEVRAGAEQVSVNTTYALSVAFNELFLVYVALFSANLFALVAC